MIYEVVDMINANKQRAFDWIDQNQQNLSDWNQIIWHLAEPAWREYKSSAFRIGYWVSGRNPCSQAGHGGF
jgi:hypothetical protein